VRGKPWATDEELLARLRAGDETAFAALLDDLNGPLLALARTFTSSPALAEDIVQETWLAVIRGLDRFAGRSALRTWMFSILVRRARTMTVRDARQGGARRASAGEETGGGPAGEEWLPGRGRVGLWEENDNPRPWTLDDPASIYQSAETLEVVVAALESLPEAQRQVVHLCDVEGLPAHDVCNILGLSGTNQRVLLHRGRAAVRRALDRYLRNGSRPKPQDPAVRVAGTRGGGGA
jgi:RNA polymerase sigma-70 factor (ECF subfamily)